MQESCSWAFPKWLTLTMGAVLSPNYRRHVFLAEDTNPMYPFYCGFCHKMLLRTYLPPHYLVPVLVSGIRGGKAQLCSSSLLCSHNSIKQGETFRSTEIAASRPDIRTSTAIYALGPAATPRVADVKDTWKLLVGDREEASFTLTVLNYQLFM